MSNHPIAFKLVLLGESAVGKSSIVLRFVKSQFIENQETTIGGQERYHSLAPMYYRGAKAAIVVYDITSANSFQRAKSWVDELNQKANTVKVIALAGNKADRDNDRAVRTEEAAAYAEEKNLIFLETSAKLDVNISLLFSKIAKQLPLDSEPARPTGGQQLTSGGPDSQQRQCCR